MLKITGDMVMSEQQNLRVVQEAFSEDAEYYVPGPREIIPFIGLRRGRAQIEDFFTLLPEVEEIDQFELLEFIARESSDCLRRLTQPRRVHRPCTRARHRASLHAARRQNRRLPRALRHLAAAEAYGARLATAASAA